MTHERRILIVEDDENLRLGLEDNLVEHGYRVDSAPDATTARTLVNDNVYELIILDIMLPDGDGYVVCEEMRAGGVKARILMLTARTLEQDIVRGFDAGADDYLAKPYRIAELLARVRALVRRVGEPSASDAPVRFGEHLLDTEARILEHTSSGAIALTRTEFDLLAYFIARAGRALHRQQILDAVWGEDIIVDERTIDNFVSNLKKKLNWSSDDPWRIVTIRGVGYRFELDPASQSLSMNPLSSSWRTIESS